MTNYEKTAIDKIVDDGRLQKDIDEAQTIANANAVMLKAGDQIIQLRKQNTAMREALKEIVKCYKSCHECAQIDQEQCSSCIARHALEVCK